MFRVFLTTNPLKRASCYPIVSPYRAAKGRIPVTPPAVVKVRIMGTALNGEWNHDEQYVAIEWAYDPAYIYIYIYI